MTKIVYTTAALLTAVIVLYAMSDLGSTTSPSFSGVTATAPPTPRSVAKTAEETGARQERLTDLGATARETGNAIANQQEIQP